MKKNKTKKAVKKPAKKKTIVKKPAVKAKKKTAKAKKQHAKKTSSVPKGASLEEVGIITHYFPKVDADKITSRKRTIPSGILTLYAPQNLLIMLMYGDAWLYALTVMRYGKKCRPPLTGCSRRRGMSMPTSRSSFPKALLQRKRNILKGLPLNVL